jgi:hypothetical protein
MSCQSRLKAGDNFFNAELGGFICVDCRRGVSRGLKSTSGAIKLIRLFLKNEIKNFTKIKAPKEDIKNITIIAGEMVKWIMG